MDNENYYKPYCTHCKKFVEPQVVAATQVYGGGNGTAVGSKVVYKKLCPECGDQVFSQSDIDTNAKNKKDQQQTWILILGILSVFCCSFFTAIPSLIIAAYARPLAIKGKIGVGCAIFSIITHLVLTAIHLHAAYPFGLSR